MTLERSRQGFRVWMGWTGSFFGFLRGPKPRRVLLSADVVRVVWFIRNGCPVQHQVPHTSSRIPAVGWWLAVSRCSELHRERGPSKSGVRVGRWSVGRLVGT